MVKMIATHPLTLGKVMVRSEKLAETMWAWYDQMEKKELGSFFRPPNGPTPAHVECAPCLRAQRMCMLDPLIEHRDRGYKCVTCPNMATCRMLENIPKYEKWFETYSKEFAQLVRRTELLEKRIEELQGDIRVLEQILTEQEGFENETHPAAS